MKSVEQFIEFKCNDDSRHIHRFVTSGKLADFAEIGRRIPVSAAIFDHGIKLLYKGEMASVVNAALIEVSNAARCLNSKPLIQEIGNRLK